MIKQIGLFLVKFGVSACVIYVLSQKINVFDVYNLLKSLSFRHVISAAVCIVLMQACFTKRWQNIVRINAPKLPFITLFKQVYIGFFMGQGLPSIVGGDVFRAIMLKDSGVPLLWGTQTLIMDRVCGMLALTFLSLVFLPLKFSVLVTSQIGIILVAVIGLLVVVFLGILFFHKIIFLKYKYLQYFHDLSSTFYDFVKSKSFTITFFWSVIGMLTHFFSMFCLAQGIGLNLTISEIATGAAVILLITALPISFAGWGLREGAMVLTFAAFGVKSSEAISLSLLLGGLQLFVSLPGLVCWIFYKRSQNPQGHQYDNRAHSKA